VLTLGMCSRNLGAALAPVMAIEPDPRAMVMLAIAIPVTVGISALTARWLLRAPPVAAVIPI
jgi:bile acid:Na+ symporter, BASS family